MSAVFDSFVMILKMSRTTKAIEMIKEMIAAVSRSFLFLASFHPPYTSYVLTTSLTKIRNQIDGITRDDDTVPQLNYSMVVTVESLFNRIEKICCT